MALVYMRWITFEPDCCLALPTASIAVMGAVNAVYANKIAALPEEERAKLHC